ncbi:MAG: Mrp/NBP35 family ATP-binding protein [Desulfovibrionaceae bacterium]|nr:Mrp/NBP35 family ATP-binding protein [Desulfovibrionaceae bacterium]
MASCSGCTPDGSVAKATLLGGENQWAAQNKKIAKVLAQIRYKILVTSGKGGVGKSSVTVNLAVALASKGYKVGILDCDIHGPSIPTLLKLNGEITADAHGLIPAKARDNLYVVSMDALMAEKDTPVLWRGTKKGQAIREFLSDVQWGSLDYLVIDSPPGTGDEPMTVLESIPEALCVVVTTPQEVSLADVRKTVNFLAQVHANNLGIVENMSGLTCPYCHQEIDLFKKGGGEKLAREHGLTFLGAIPLDPASVVASDQGVPVVELTVDSPAKNAFNTLAQNIIHASENSLEILAQMAHRS